jgi:hypothetical protein
MSVELSSLVKPIECRWGGVSRDRFRGAAVWSGEQHSK